MKAVEGLVGKAIEIIVSDPWDFVTDHGGGPFAAVVDRIESDRLLVHLDLSIEYGGQAFDYLVVSPRAECDDIADLAVAGRTINCGLVGVSSGAARSNHPCDLESWRGGLALLGSIKSMNGDAPPRD